MDMRNRKPRKMHLFSFILRIVLKKLKIRTIIQVIKPDFHHTLPPLSLYGPQPVQYPLPAQVVPAAAAYPRPSASSW